VRNVFSKAHSLPLQRNSGPVRQPLLYQWQFSQAPWSSQTAILIPVAVQSGTLFQSDSHSYTSDSSVRHPGPVRQPLLYQWQFSQAPWSTEPATFHGSDSPVRLPGPVSQPLIPVTVPSGSLVQSASHSHTSGSSVRHPGSVSQLLIPVAVPSGSLVQSASHSYQWQFRQAHWVSQPATHTSGSSVRHPGPLSQPLLYQ
jgi:hypothetical protein